MKCTREAKMRALALAAETAKASSAVLENKPQEACKALRNVVLLANDLGRDMLTEVHVHGRWEELLTRLGDGPTRES